MRKLVCQSPGVAVLVEYEDREIRENEVRIRVDFASPKHGTEAADFRGTTPFIDGKYDPDWHVFMPREAEEPRGIQYGDLPLGNMFVGTVIEKGTKVTDYDIGDRVCSYGSIQETHIRDGVDNFRLRKMDSKASVKNAVCYDPAQFALGAVRDAHVRAGDNVVVIGLGAIGQIAVQLAKKAGASIVIAVDPISRRRGIARRHGADHALDPTACDVGLEIKRMTGRVGADAVIETSGNVGALQSGLKGLAYGGTLAYVAFSKPFPAGLWLGQEAHFNYGHIIFSRACSEPNPDHPRWTRRRIEEACWSLLMEGYLDCEEIIYPVVDFEFSAEAFSRYVDTHPDESIKLGITFGGLK